MLNQYQPRKIEFQELVLVEEWKVKVYTISKDLNFDSKNSYQLAVSKLPVWLRMKNSFNSSHDNIAFLIVHFGTEGVFAIVNWWVGKHMLNTHIFMSEHDKEGEFKYISKDGLAPCVWEHEIIHHESRSWVSNILKDTGTPNYSVYLDDTYNNII